jgi:hypothetical protein
MSYEFNADSNELELPNPYKVENLVTIISGLFILLSGIVILISVRGRIAHAIDGRALLVAGISIGLISFSIWLLSRAFIQLRFFFGRNRPSDLAPQVAPDKDGDSQYAKTYKEVLRQSAITFQEPSGAINGFLYFWMPHLIFAPRVIQDSAQTQFYNFLSLTATLLSFLFCWLLFGQGAANGWIGIIYGAFFFFQIMRPMASRSSYGNGAVNESANVGTSALITLIVAAVLGPVVLGLCSSKLPTLNEISINGVVLIALICTLAGIATFGLALKNQLQPKPQVLGAARVVETMTMNAHPNKLVEELDRVLMKRWFKDIPNRKYTRRSPIVEGPQGQFESEIFEETQPRPQKKLVAENISHALSSPQFFWLTCLTGLAFAYLMIGTISSIFLSQEILNGDQIWTTITFSLSLFSVGVFCYRAAHILWGRFDFVSELLWVDIGGSFESAKVQIGNQLSGNVQTTKNVINIESMTLRVWVSEIDTVIFGKDSVRQIVGMRGLPDFAGELATRLKEFGEQRSMIVAPTSVNDLDRAQKIGAMNKLIGGAPTEQLSIAAAAIASNLNTAHDPIMNIDAAKKTQTVCGSCNFAMDADAHFCPECGTRVSV